MSANEQAGPTTRNIDRLRAHLEDESLAAELVKTYDVNEPEKRADALTALALQRLQEIEAELSDADSDAED